MENKIILYVHNDGKYKDNSFEVWSSILPDRGYGITQQDATNDYFNLVMSRIGQMQKLLKGNYKFLQCDWEGNQI